jgi:hypothetical protein
MRKLAIVLVSVGSLLMLTGVSIFQLPVDWKSSESKRYAFAEDKWMSKAASEVIDSTDTDGHSLDLHSLAVYVWCKTAGMATDSVRVSLTFTPRSGSAVVAWYTLYPTTKAATSPKVPSTVIFNGVLPVGIRSATLAYPNVAGTSAWMYTVYGTFQHQAGQ